MGVLVKSFMGVLWQDYGIGECLGVVGVVV